MRKALCWCGLLAISSAIALAKPPPQKRKTDDEKSHSQAGAVSPPMLKNAVVVPDEELPPVEPLAELEKPKAEEIAPRSAPAVEIPKRFLAAYFAERPKQYLVDPQKLLGGKDFQERLDFLNYHASDSSIDFYLYVFGRDQEIPGEVRAEETVERLFSGGRPVVVVFYFLGEPQRSTIHLSPSLTEKIPAAEQRRALQSSVMAAFEKLDFASQLDAFSVQMSIRIYWMERMLGGAEKADASSEAVVKVVPPKAHTLDKIKAIATDYGAKWGGMAALGGGVLLLISGLMIWLRLRGGRRFPDLEVEPRLGGAHCAGIGAVISFASASVPPASQKDQVPDYLRRA
jgi:hypothetical protein